MKRLALFGLVILLVGAGTYAYYQYGGGSEARRERYLKAGQNYLKEGKLNEAILQLRNAVKADPRSGEARLELANALIKGGDLRSA